MKIRKWESDGTHYIEVEGQVYILSEDVQRDLSKIQKAFKEIK